MAFRWSLFRKPRKPILQLQGRVIPKPLPASPAWDGLASTIINWEKIGRVRAEHGWTWQKVADKIGISGPHLSDLRAGRRKPNLLFVACACVGLELEWADVLKPLPRPKRGLSGREWLGLEHLEDGRPWPVKYDKQTDAFLRHQREQQLQANVQAFS